MVALRLTTEQQAALRENPSAEAIPVFDPASERAYFLVPADVYAKLCGADGDPFVMEDNFPRLDEGVSRDGWEAPQLGVFDPLNPRAKSDDATA